MTMAEAARWRGRTLNQGRDLNILRGALALLPRLGTAVSRLLEAYGIIFVLEGTWLTVIYRGNVSNPGYLSEVSGIFAHFPRVVLVAATVAMIKACVGQLIRALLGPTLPKQRRRDDAKD
jgi:hypothetical protein